MSRRTYAHLLASWALSACAIVATPYGIAYPLQLFGDLVLGHRPRPDVAWNAAYRSVIAAIGEGFYFEELFVLMAALLVILAGFRFRRAPRGARFDWTILLGNLAYIPLYVVYLRGTFMWPAVFAYSALQQLHEVSGVGAVREPPHTAVAMRRAASGDSRIAPTSPRLLAALRECTVALFLFLAARACLTAWFHPFYESWLGFGISYVNPVAPEGPDSPIGTVLSKGIGAYHVCYAVKALEPALVHVGAHGCVIVANAVPAVAFGGRRVAWFYMPTRQLVELVEEA